MTSLAPSFLICSLFLQVMKTIKSQMDSKLGSIRPRTAELAALERLGKSPYAYDGRNVLTTQGISCLNESSFLQ